MHDPCGPNTDLLPYHGALTLLLAHAPGMPVEICDIGLAPGRVLASAVKAGNPLPAFDNAAMDGYALRCRGAALLAGSVHTIAGTIAAGDPPPECDAAAWAIMTGAPLPPGTDTIVPVEHTERLDLARMRLTRNVLPGQHLRRQGSDMQPGQLLASPGQRADATLTMLLAAQGIAHVQVRMRPRVAILGTGSELVSDPQIALGPGQIRASNGPFLMAAVQALGAQVITHRTLNDTPEAFLQVLDEVRGGCDLILTTGAVSAGVHDFIPAALRQAGARTLFHKTAIRPGKPLLAATLPAGPLVLGLPGNPTATAACFRFFAVPWLRAQSGLPPEHPLRARLLAGVRGRPGLRQFLKARVEHDIDGQLQVQVLAGQESFRMGALLHANAWAVLEEEDDHLTIGTPIQVLPRDPAGSWCFDQAAALTCTGTDL